VGKRGRIRGVRGTVRVRVGAASGGAALAPGAATLRGGAPVFGVRGAGAPFACVRSLARGCVLWPRGGTPLRLNGVRRRNGLAPGTGRGARSWRRPGRVRCRRLARPARTRRRSDRRRIGRRACSGVARRAAPTGWAALSRRATPGRRAASRTGLGRRAVSGPLRLLRRADSVRLLDEERIRFLSRGGVAVRVDQLDRIGRSRERRVGRLAHRWVSQTGRHGNDEHRGQPSRNPHCVGTGAHSLAVVEGSGCVHPLANPLAHAPRRPTRA
jgi:hypothetical protein